MRIYYDTEFLENGHTIELISIGMVAQDGREYYAVNADMPQGSVWDHPWLRENVWPQLPRIDDRPYGLDYEHPDVRGRDQIALEVRAFLLADDRTPELWADYAGYDHVALCQLWGTMADLPQGLPMFTHELQQEIEKMPAGDPGPQQTSGAHHALADARHARELGRWVGHRFAVAPAAG